MNGSCPYRKPHSASEQSRIAGNLGSSTPAVGLSSAPSPGSMTVDSEAKDEAYMKLIWRADPIVRECIVKLRQAERKDVQPIAAPREPTRQLNDFSCEALET